MKLSKAQLELLSLKSSGGRTVDKLLERIESYNFECEAGPLTKCVDWLRLKSLLTRPERDLLQTLESRFTSGNDVPVTRAMITREEYEQLRSLLTTKVQALEGENEVLREQNAALNQENVAMERDLEAARRERDEARSLHARLANSTGYLVDRIKRLEALVREMAREGGQAPTAEKEIARIAAETRTPQAGEE